MFFRKVPSVNYKDLSYKDTIIDVREVSEYKAHHLKNTKNVPLSRIESFKSNEPVYVICASGTRSKRAVKILRKKGIEAYNIEGGISSVKG